MTSNGQGKDDGESRLLYLPQSDLKRSTRPNLMLMAVPSSSASTMQQAFHQGDCKLVTSSKSSALVLPDKSYDLTTIGTSNTLVVYPKQEKSTTDSSPDNNRTKRQKLSDNDNNLNRQECRLIHPGGSGASFLSLTLKTSQAEAIHSLLKDATTKYDDDSLALELQCSVVEIRKALETLPCIEVDSTGNIQLLTEEEHWQAKRSLVETLCEEADAEDEQVPPEAFHRLVANRLVATNKEDGRPNNGADAVAEKIVTLACAPPSDDGSQRRNFDKQTIALWALQDLVLTSRQTTWPLDELLSSWQTRLPLKWCGGDDNGTTNVASRAVLEEIPGVEITEDGNKQDAGEIVTIQI
eukprot:scaffold2619_cov129-Cylindrotheca_fusiformis.AAC.5